MSITSSEIEYQVNGESFTGYFACEDDGKAKPGALIVHEWWGHNDYVRGRAEQLAGDGYAAFALDMYGTGKSADNPTQAEALMNDALGTEGAIEARFDAALTLLNDRPETGDKVFALGYCFGGAVVLNMARAGKALAGIASFHGLLETDSPMEKGAFSGPIRAFTGADDPMVTPEIVSGFEQEMQSANADYALISYPGVLHAFTNPAATARGEKYGFPLKYDEAADKDSYAKMLESFATA